MKDIKMMSLDTSTSSSGFAIWNNGKYCSSSFVQTDKKIKGDEKLDSMIKLLYNLIDKEQPSILITEMVVPTRNAQSTRMLQELIGSIRGYCVGHDIDYFSLRPGEWRKAVVDKVKQKPAGRKREDQKEWSLDVVNNKLNISATNDDESDAILLGYGYIQLCGGN